METYTETIYQFVVEEKRYFSDKAKAEMRLNGIDPDNYWGLKWSFKNRGDAEKQKKYEEERLREFNKEHGYNLEIEFRVRDLGETKYIQRSAWI